MKLGIGSGSTVVYVVERLLQRVKEENLGTRTQLLLLFLTGLDVSVSIVYVRLALRRRCVCSHILSSYATDRKRFALRCMVYDEWCMVPLWPNCIQSAYVSCTFSLLFFFMTTSAVITYTTIVTTFVKAALYCSSPLHPSLSPSLRYIPTGSLKLGDLSRYPSLDVCIDGADEVDSDLHMIKVRIV